MADSNGKNGIYAVLIFLVVGSAFVGMEAVIPPAPPYDGIMIEDGCQKYFSDDDGDGYSGMNDIDCMDYPYEDGSGELGTNNPFQQPMTPGANYQPYWDLSVDYTRFIIMNECGGSLNNCLGTNWAHETHFYCDYTYGQMEKDWGWIFNRFFNQLQTLPDDGSINTWQNICEAFPPSSMPPTLPLIEHQQTAPIPSNPSGNTPGGGLR